MNDDTKGMFDALRVCVENEGDGGIAWFGTKEKEELFDLIDTMEERWDMWED